MRSGSVVIAFAEMATILITGTSMGIGMATALELARAGHVVLATMRSPERSPELGRIAADEGLRLSVHRLDVDSDESVKAAFAEIEANGIVVDALVNNAGVERLGTIEESPLEDFRTCMETNYFGAIRCMQAVLPSMRERRAGLIVNVTSVAGRISNGAMGAYSASKWALEAVSESLAQEVTGFGVRVAIVEPGIIDTRMAQSVTKPLPESKYSHAKRLKALFVEALAAGNGPEHVAKKVREIVESGDGKLRHPAGPDAVPFLQWRGAMTDEKWIEYGSQSDEAWLEQVGREFGMKPKLN